CIHRSAHSVALPSFPTRRSSDLEVSGLSEHKSGVVIRTRQGGDYEASTLISCSGLMADRLVKMLGLEPGFIICPFRGEYFRLAPNRKSTRLNSSHVSISYAVFCL